jgi:hypothetical protein
MTSLAIARVVSERGSVDATLSFPSSISSTVRLEAAQAVPTVLLRDCGRRKFQLSLEAAVFLRELRAKAFDCVRNLDRHQNSQSDSRRPYLCLLFHANIRALPTSNRAGPPSIPSYGRAKPQVGRCDHSDATCTVSTSRLHGDSPCEALRTLAPLDSAPQCDYWRESRRALPSMCEKYGFSDSARRHSFAAVLLRKPPEMAPSVWQTRLPSLLPLQSNP